jgi:hypothetical protein
MNETGIARYICEAFPGVETSENFGYKFFFFGAERMLPFATLANADYEYDSVSNLDRPEVYRLNIGVSRKTFTSLFRSSKVEPGDYDFTALDTIMPHPEYARQYWICVLSPGEASLDRVRLLLAEAYAIAVRREGRPKNTR